ncbi:hypothetical protein IPG41_03720 [Candidatus Peregrinibacteria bacterium]|nr:MAG: hypothetical protein IPG41_03720 [Candidatus Peregrinibacteria bacterium]
MQYSHEKEEENAFSEDDPLLLPAHLNPGLYEEKPSSNSTIKRADFKVKSTLSQWQAQKELNPR